MERYLEKGYTLQMNGGGKYVITDMIGRGSSCAVYRAEHCTADGVQTEQLLKEYNPRALSITRTDDGMMCISEEDRDVFCAGLAHFRAGYEKQLGLRQTDELRNSTSNIQNIFDANGTRYIDMTLFTGSTYSDIKEKSLYELCKRMKAVTQVVGNYHKAGLLHLDIKPDNIFAIPETCELVMLFDFDSVIEKGNVAKSVGLSYTKTWAAPEQTVAAYRRRICEATDLYAIGEMMFWQIFGRHSTNEEHRSFFEYQFDTEADIFKNVNPKVFPLLSELLHHTIATSVQNRYQSADELIAALDELIKLSDPKEPYIKKTLPVVQSFFVGRNAEMEEIHSLLQANRILFLNGIGGIGKSELAKQYASRYQNEYDSICFAPFLSDVNTLILNDSAIPIVNFSPISGEFSQNYFDRKLCKLKELCDNRTLIIVDNLTTDKDENLEKLLNIGCKLLITTRVDFSQYNYPCLTLNRIAKQETVHEIFSHYYTKKVNAATSKEISQIIDLLDGHTMAVELLAKQMMAGRVTPAKMLQKLAVGGFGMSGEERVCTAKDGTLSTQCAYDHIRALFDLSGLCEGEKIVLANLSLIPQTGIPTELFHSWCKIEGYDTINELVIGGWVRMDKEHDIISLHPVVGEIAFSLFEEEKVRCSSLIKECLNLLKLFYETIEKIKSEFNNSADEWSDFADKWGLSNKKQLLLFDLPSMLPVILVMGFAFVAPAIALSDIFLTAIYVLTRSNIMGNSSQLQMDCLTALRVISNIINNRK